jgi:myo-inositol 2-dehydrogenase/D-chiro-inositol 1-dehydrogenase
MKLSSSTGAALARRQFLKNSGLAVVAGTLAAPKAVAQSAVSPGQTLRVGLIGCGDRGTGAAAQALAADPNVKLLALGDAFRDRLEGSLATLKKQQSGMRNHPSRSWPFQE